MTDASDLDVEAEKPRGLRERFPGHFPPSDADIIIFITQGLIAFDTNALFDVYRFNSQARREYLASIRLLGDRLWIPNRVAEELLNGRLDIIRECSNATSKLVDELNGPFEIIRQKIRSFGNRRGLTPDNISILESLIDKSLSELSAATASSFTFDLEVDTSLRADPILREIEGILDGKIGPPLSDFKAEKQEGLRRIAEKVPPGYADSKKDPDRAIGDYLIWRQLIKEANRRSLPVLLVNNDQKEDWVREYQGRTIGPRPELVAEMLRDSGQQFHLIGVKSFLLHAQKYLGATVSDSTVQQAEQLNIAYEHLGQFMVRWAELEEAIVDRVQRLTGTRPRSLAETIRLYGQLTEMSADEVAQIHNLRRFRNMLAHTTEHSSIDKEGFELFLTLIEKHIARARGEEAFPDHVS